MALQYEGQTHRVVVPVPSDEIDAGQIATLFEEEYRRKYSVSVTNFPIVLVMLRVHAVATRNVSDVVLKNLAQAAAQRVQTSEGAHGKARIRFNGAWHEASICDRSDLAPGRQLEGPARIDQKDTTTVIPPGWTAAIDQLGYVRISKEGAQP